MTSVVRMMFLGMVMKKRIFQHNEFLMSKNKEIFVQVSIFEAYLSYLCISRIVNNAI